MNGRRIADWERARARTTPPPTPHDDLPGSPPVTVDALKAHAKRFGSAAVEATAHDLGLRVEVDATPAPRRRRKR